jgi:hypothetical protein
MNTTAIAIMDFVDEHLYRARRMKTAYTHTRSRDAGAFALEDYRKPPVASCGPDATQLLPRLAFALLAAEASHLFPQRKAFVVELSVMDLAWHPSDGHNGDTEHFRLEKVRADIMTAFADAHIFGCFRPYRYANYSRRASEEEFEGDGMFVFEAHFLVWGCKTNDFVRHLEQLVDRHEWVTTDPKATWDSIEAAAIPKKLLDLVSVPNSQCWTDWIDIDAVYARWVPFDGCAELELKEILKNRQFSSMIFARGEGQRIIDAAQKYLPAVRYKKS